MQVKILYSNYHADLERQINNFLETIEPKRDKASTSVIDIKYAETWMWKGASCLNISAIILYK